ncbi:alanyl-tRNA editing protein [Aestuariispira insulae]|uniref:Alanine--tRNA ligase n=1 Tax=Aestuariispira insulae TaxID=1461337 RepID=A0A3D9HNE9_9PROT|nr:alanyl-tRNA editing protein [Aestuariispira insulae]RED50998.1 misacylated tRNA(Ala) deacylase [Aestuariispira insulae]
MTEALYREDAYLRECSATVTAINDRGGIILDKTVFYPTGGGQPGDSGCFELPGGRRLVIATTVKGDGPDEIIHVPAAEQDMPAVGDQVKAVIDWERRYRHMRMHSAMHLMCSVVPCGVTGGQVGEAKSRLDFDIGDHVLDKEEITRSINELVENDELVSAQWILDAELDASPDLVRTMSVQPPRGSGRIRLVKIGEATDLQPCGGTHVKRTSEIGRISVSKIENKGKRNRRVNIIFE